MTVKRIASDRAISYFKGVVKLLLTKSLEKSAEEQGLSKLIKRLEAIVPDISKQYSVFELNAPYLLTNVRTLHAFQISLVESIMSEFEKLVIVDIGDSSGTHLKYIMGLCANKGNIKCFSVNLDTKAVEKIRAMGLEAVNARAEDLHEYNIDVDLFLCFETLEHLMNPCYFLHELASKTNAKYLIVTVPYLRKSRIGLHHIRTGRGQGVCAENTHIFELNPEDWKLIIRHSGWNIKKEQVYLQYPRKSFFRLTEPIWRKYDFEGFYGLILQRDDTWSAKYSDW